MFDIASLNQAAPIEVVAAGEVLRERHQRPLCVLHLDSGRVLLGVRSSDGVMRHQLGMVQGPVWLDAAAALLGQPNALDMVADTRVQLRRVPLKDFQRMLGELTQGAVRLLRDVAAAYCQQTDLTVSRLVQDAEARCARWLLSQARSGEEGVLRVTLRQRKRVIAAQLGIAPETFSRVLRHLRERGLIAGTGNVLDLPQPRALQMLAGALPHVVKQ